MSLDFYLELAVDTGGEPYTAKLYGANYTHNVTPMWRQAGCYDALYNSDGMQAGDVVDALDAGLRYFDTNRAELRKLNPENGWGDADRAREYLAKALEACRRFPRARVRVCK